MATTTVPKASRAWTFEKTSTGAWIGSLEPQADRYRAACERPTCRNRGPKGPSLGGGPKRWVKTFWVVSPITELRAGTVLRDGQIVPPTGYILHNVPLAPPCYSVGQGKKLLRKLRRRHAYATLIGLASDPRYAQKTPAHLSTPTSGNLSEMRHE